MLLPGPNSLSLIRMLLANDPLQMMHTIAKEYGEAAYLKMGGRAYVAAFGPQWHQAILAKQQVSFNRYHRPYARYLYPNDLERLDGERHAQQRRLLAPLYTKGAINQHIDALHSILDSLLTTWRLGTELELKEQIWKLLVRYFIYVILGVEFEDSYAESIYESIRRIRLHASTRTGFISDFMPGFLPFSTLSLLRKDLSRLNELYESIICAHTSKYISTKNLPIDTLKAHSVVTLPGAVGVTTAATVWALFLILQHPNIHSRLLEEIQYTLGIKQASITDLGEMRYLDQVIKESLRLYSNVGIISRVAIEDVNINSYDIPKNSYIGLIPYVLHRNPSLYDAPYEFSPERFEGQRVDNLSHVYLPFGTGAHNCIGQNLALLSMKVIVTSILQRYSLKLIPNQQLYERMIVTQEIHLRLRVKVSMQDGKVDQSKARITGDAVGAEPGPKFRL